MRFKSIKKEISTEEKHKIVSLFGNNTLSLSQSLRKTADNLKERIYE